MNISTFPSKIFSRFPFLSLASLSILLINSSAFAAPTIQYDCGDPTAQEQYILELLNAARANPPLEGQLLAATRAADLLAAYQYYNINTNQIAAQFAQYQVAPPLSMNVGLLQAARNQSIDQADHGTQSHIGSNGSTLQTRISSVGYTYAAIGENLFSYCEDPFYGDAAFLVDWGVSDLGHRINCLNYSGPLFKEIGIGLVDSPNTKVGPQVLTEDFGTSTNPTNFLVGVIYNDKNHNNQYDPGEGLAGVTIMPDQGDYYAVSSTSGGYSIPLPSGFQGMNVTVSGGALGKTITKYIPAVNANTKIDFTPSDSDSTAPNNSIFTLSMVATNSVSAALDNPATILIQRTGNLSEEAKVKLVVRGNAQKNIDYVALPKFVTLAPNQASMNLQVQTTAQTGENKFIKLKLKAPAGSTYQIDKTSAKVRIDLL